MQQTPRFGVPCNPPSKELFDLTLEQEAWLAWWHKAYKDWAEKNPKKHQKWESFETTNIPRVKPKGSYKDFLEKE